MLDDSQTQATSGLIGSMAIAANPIESFKDPCIFFRCDPRPGICNFQNDAVKAKDYARLASAIGTDNPQIEKLLSGILE